MKLAVIDNFLSKGSGQIPDYPGLRGVGIHSSSEVESFEVGGLRVGVKSVAPLGGQGGQLITATRIAISKSGGLFGGWNSPPASVPADGNASPGEKLVLQLYECKDELNIPGPRAPYLTRAFVNTLPTTQATTQLIMKLPMSGRLRATISWTNTSAGDVVVNLVGLRALYGSNVGEMPIINPTSYTNTGTTGGVGPTFGGTIYTRQIYVDNESFDDLWVFAYSPSGSSLIMIGECTGERLT